MGVGGGPGVPQDAGDGRRRRRQTLVRRVGRRSGNADDGGGEVLITTVQLEVVRLGVEAGSTGERHGDRRQDLSGFLNSVVLVKVLP